MRQTFAIALLGFCANAGVTNLPTDDHRFSQWASRHGRQYTTALELAERKANWMKADAAILRLELEHPDARFGHNQFSDYYPEELAALTGLQEPNEDGSRLLQADPNVGAMDTSAVVNWAAPGANKVGPVKNQGGCGSCWAFAASTNQEAIDQITHGKSYVRHSEQEYVDCSAGSCNGGWFTQAWYWSRDNGVSAESDYPYVARDQACAHAGKTKVSSVDTVGSLPSTAEAERYLKETGPFTVAVAAGNSTWYQYSGGVIKGNCTADRVDHGVVVVGMGYTPYFATELRDVEKEVCIAATNGDIKKQSCKGGKFYKAETQQCCEMTTVQEEVQVEKQDPYWIIQNSWGSGWGEGGFMKIQRTEDSVGVCLMNQYRLTVSTKA